MLMLSDHAEGDDDVGWMHRGIYGWMIKVV